MTTMVMMPMGHVARRMSSAQPNDKERNCLVASSPKRMSNGPTADAIELTKSVVSSPSALSPGVGTVVDMENQASRSSDPILVRI